ncbi:MAG: sigma-70 family RNA polymerase sigma factor [Planctomycetota bacterium]
MDGSPVDFDPANLDPARLLADLRWTAGVALALVREPGAADDLAQEAWLIAARRGRADGPPTRRWRAATVRNLARRRVRAEGRRREHERGAEELRPREVPSTEELAQRTEAQRRVAALVLELAPDLREALLLRYQEGLATAAIARRLGVSQSTVQWRLRKGLGLLRAELERERGDGWQALALTAVPSTIAPTTGLPAAKVAAGLGWSAWMGLTMSGTAWKFLGAATLVAALGVWWGGERGPAAEPASPRTAAETPAAHTVAPAARVDEVEPELERPAETVAPKEPRVASAGGEPEVAWIRGRAVDGDGAPLPGAELWLSRGAGWRTLDVDWRLAARSLSDGAFALGLRAGDLAALDAEMARGRMYLRLDAGLFREAEIWEVADGTEGQVLTPAAGTEIDLGEVALRAVGVIRGRIDDAAGDPYDEVFVAAESEHDRGLARVEADGSFLVRELSAGVYRVTAAGPTSRHVVVGEAVEVRVGEIAELPPAALVPGYPVRGRVADPSGRPIAGAEISVPCHPLLGTLLWYGRRAATSDAEGRFELRAPIQGEVPVEVTAAGYAGLGYDEPGSEVSAAEERVLTLQPRLDPVLFRVTDRDTGEPLEDFCLVVQREATGEARIAPAADESPERGPHPGGEARRRVLAGDSFVVRAEGYLDHEGSVYRAYGPGEVVKVRLDPLRTVVGRVLREGRPAAGVEVVLDDALPCIWSRRRFAGVEEERTGRHLDAFPGRVQMFATADVVEGLDAMPPWTRAVAQRGSTPLDATRTDGEGRFAFAAPSTGPFQLDVRGEGPMTVHLASVWPGPGENDLGDLELATPAAAGALRGRIDARGLERLDYASLKLLPGGASVRTAADGSFAFEGLAPGGYWLGVSGAEREISGLFRAAPDFYLELAAGEQRTLQLDLSAFLCTRFDPLVRLNGAEPGAQARLRLTTPAGEPLDFDARLREAGTVLYPWLPAHGDVLVHLEMGRSTEDRGTVFEPIGGAGLPWRLERPGPRGEGATGEPTFDFEASPAAVVVGATLSPEAEQRSAEVLLTREGATLSRQTELAATDGVHRGSLGWLAPGRYEATVRVGARESSAQLLVRVGSAAELVVP